MRGQKLLMRGWGVEVWKGTHFGNGMGLGIDCCRTATLWFLCMTVHGLVNVFVSWLVVGRNLVLPSGTLLIANSTRRDSGTYRCAAYNPVADARTTSPATHRLRVTPTGQSCLLISLLY